MLSGKRLPVSTKGLVDGSGGCAETDFLQAASVSARSHPACGVAVFPLHPEPAGCRGTARDRGVSRSAKIAVGDAAAAFAPHVFARDDHSNLDCNRRG